MKNVYFFQPNAVYGGETSIPYAPGTLVAYAWSRPGIAKEYCLKAIYYRKEPADTYLQLLEEPYLVGFSCYIWNFEYCKDLAKKIKQAFPGSLILFGGHSVPDHSPRLLQELPYVDFLLHEEGEVPFYLLLRALAVGDPLENVPNCSYRKGASIQKNENCVFPVEDFPSPYTSGVFDEMVERSGDRFYGILETNRGCPYNCIYCDWGKRGVRIRSFPMERVRGDIDWFATHGIEYCIGADANFGILPRDGEIADLLIEAKKKTGCPGRVQFCFMKDSSERVFEINQKLNAYGLSKGATISLQTLSPEATACIGRKNISFDLYRELIKKYNAAGIPAYTDLILGLPGETLESFVEGYAKLLEAGQHNSVNVFNCEMLVNAGLGDLRNQEKYQIRTAPCSLNRHHSELGAGMTEANEVVISTYSMNERDWVLANLYVAEIGCFHHLGLLRLFAIYLFYEKDTGYADFYRKLLSYLLDRPGTAAGRVFLDLREKLTNVTKRRSICECPLEAYGNVNWPIEEWCFLRIVSEFDRFFDETVDFLRGFFEDESVFEALLLYQKSLVKLPGKASVSFDVPYDFPAFFDAANSGAGIPLPKKSLHIDIHDPLVRYRKDEYARETVWYGRKGGTNLFGKEMRIEEAHDAV